MIIKKLINQKEVKNISINQLEKMNLEYYLVEQEIGLNRKVYGVEIIKKKEFCNQVFMESEIFNDISPVKEYVEKTVKLLADNVVTPVTLFDILVDRLGCNI